MLCIHRKGGLIISDTGYENMHSFKNLYNAHMAARRGKRDKSDVIRFEMNLAENLCALQLSLHDKTYSLLCRIIDSYETAPGKGLPLGNQASQWFALLYLDEMDRLIKEKMRVKYYVRYMDDFILLHHNKTYLQECLARIAELFHDSLHLQLNEKTQIFPVKNGVKYLGWHFYLTETGKVLRKLQASGKRRTKRRFRRLKKDYSTCKIALADVKRSLVSTHGHLIHGHTYRLRSKLWEQLVLAKFAPIP